MYHGELYDIGGGPCEEVHHRCFNYPVYVHAWDLIIAALERTLTHGINGLSQGGSLLRLFFALALSLPLA